MIYFGIDPGSASGAIAALGPAAAAALDFPASEVDVYKRIELAFDAYRFDVSVVIERIQMTPKTREWAGTQKLLGSYHSVRGMLIALGVPFEALTPRQWQAEIGCPKGTKTSAQHKRDLVEKAKCLFPHAKVTARNGDAFLLAEICRRRGVRS